MANNRTVLNRLVGLETEYALQLRASGEKTPLSRYSLFQRFLVELRRRTLTVPARHFKEGVFLANGGAAWFETERMASGGGLFEGSTPECRSPRQLLIHQRAQDALFSEAVIGASHGRVALMKNDRDGAGNVYGSQENYESQFATGWRLVAWRIWLSALLPLALVTWLGLWALTLGILMYGLAACGLCLALEALRIRPRWLTRVLFGAELDELENMVAGPVWLEKALNRLTLVWTSPLSSGLLVGLWLFAFQAQRRQLTPFLMSRAVIGGSGRVDQEGKFHLASKGDALTCVLGLGVFGERALFACGHFLKPLCDTRWSWLDISALFAGRQRLQISLGDSNLCEEAEYLRIATTSLVLDVIEAGELPPLPRLRQPIKALRTYSSDPTLQVQVQVGEQGVTAVELQRFYLKACRRFLEVRPTAPAEARDIVRRWEAVLDALETDPNSLVGTLDWVTKQMLLERTAAQASWAAKKKVDLRYHELSPHGYFRLFENAGLATRLLEPEEVERAQRNPPLGTPAAARSHFIREFSGGDEPLTVSWRAVYLGSGWRTRRISLDRYSSSRPRRSSKAATPTEPRSGARDADDER